MASNTHRRRSRLRSGGAERGGVDQRHSNGTGCLAIAITSACEANHDWLSAHFADYAAEGLFC
jgi:hypothetical protein